MNISTINDKMYNRMDGVAHPQLSNDKFRQKLAFSNLIFKETFGAT